MKLELVFVLTLENAFSKRLCFKANRKNRFFEKNVLGTFKIAFCLRVGMFLSESQWKFGTFSILTLKQILWKTKTFFKKLKYCFLLETTKIENALFSYKSAISEANVKTNRMVGRKWTYHKEKSFASYCFILLKILFQFKNVL